MRRIRDNESGIALTMVVIVGFAMMLLVVSSMAFSMNSLDLSRRDQDWGAALSAAEAGIDDYLYRLNRIDSYWQYSSSNPPPPAVDVNNAFTQWVPVPGAANEGRFRYTVDSSAFASTGVIKVTSTGLVNDTTRTVHGTLRRRNFLDFLYFTEYETKDPAVYDPVYGDPLTPAQAQTLCARHWYPVPSRATTSGNNCIDINFVTGDVIRGPLHTNDAFLVCGSPQFQGETSTSWNDPAGVRFRRNTSCSNNNPTFARAGDPKLEAPLTIPPSNSAIKNYTDPALGETGCLFTGPTRIVLNSTGTMNVTSPYTRTSNCTTGSNRPLPPNGVIYVQNIPANPADPNYWPGSTCPPHPLGYPITNDMTTYNCRSGDVFLYGVLKGRLTIATANNIIVIGDTTYQGGTAGTDLLGLVADNYVEAYHPVQCTAVSSGRCTAGTNLSTTNAQGSPSGTVNLDIHAAILSVAHSFRVQNYRWGASRGNLNVVGAIAQKYRGIVGTTGGTGYIKNYLYDQRLRYQSPPHFLDPVKSAWQVATWAELKPCYPSSTGPVRSQAPCV